MQKNPAGKNDCSGALTTHPPGEDQYDSTLIDEAVDAGPRVGPPPFPGFTEAFTARKIIVNTVFEDEAPGRNFGHFSREEVRVMQVEMDAQIVAYLLPRGNNLAYKAVSNALPIIGGVIL